MRSSLAPAWLDSGYASARAPAPEDTAGVDGAWRDSAAISAGGGDGGAFYWYNATPITSTLSGRPVRAAYESGSEVK
ncbi:MAG: hypothetical protein O3A06_09550 [Proteobacteria bacterium]|nr:hypothetical protein [Pseudomonadota bacterium]